MASAKVKASNEAASTEIPITHIKPSKGLMSINFAEIFRYRELFGFMVWRDIKVRYKQTVLGFIWAVIGPLASTVIFTLLFGRLAKLPNDGLPAPVFYMSGLIIWRYFAGGLGAVCNSLVANQTLLTKIYVPRLILPIAPLVTCLVDFAIAFFVFLLMLLYFNILPAITIVIIPFLLLLAMGAALGLGLLFAALNVRYRDVNQIVPFLTQLWMYVTIIIPFSMIPEKYGNLKYLYGLNPMGGVVEGFRWCLVHHRMTENLPFPWQLLLIGTGVVSIMMLVGLTAFKRMEQQFADVI